MRGVASMGCAEWLRRCMQVQGVGDAHLHMPNMPRAQALQAVHVCDCGSGSRANGRTATVSHGRPLRLRRLDEALSAGGPRGRWCGEEGLWGGPCVCAGGLRRPASL